MSACDQYVPLLTAYQDNTLTAEQAERVRAHVAACPACRERLDALETAYASLADLPSWPAGDAVVLAEGARARWQQRASAPARGWRPALAAAAALLLALVTAYCWWPLGRQPSPVANAPRPLQAIPLPVTEPSPVPSVVPPKAVAPRHRVAARVPSPASSRRIENKPAIRKQPGDASPKQVTHDEATTTPAPDPFASYVEVVADAMRANGGEARPCVVLPLQPGAPGSTACADVATVALVAELGRLQPGREVHRLPPWPADVEVSPDGTLSHALQALARDTDGYLVFGRLTPCEQGMDIALYVIDGRDGSVVLNGAHPVRFDGV
ncbi:MAG: anti-sigma factor family protein [Armatimonadota bacterium]